MYTVTIHDASRISNLPPVSRFDNSADAWEYGQSIKDLLPSLRIDITNSDGRRVQLQENGWSRII